MQILQGKKILLGISGGIAAYKTPELVRRLKDQRRRRACGDDRRRKSFHHTINLTSGVGKRSI